MGSDIAASGIGRRTVLTGSALLAATLAAAPATAAASPTALFEQTYLKAVDGERQNLARYIVANWFAMDAKATAQGFFTSFELLEDVDDNKDWDLVMVVGYPQAAGYENPATMAAFKAIRAAHTEVLIDGKGLDRLGAIVRHHRLKVFARGA